MRPTPLFLLIALPVLAACAGTADGPRRQLLSAGDCLDPAAARSWHHPGGGELLVDAGRRKYRIRLAESCNELGTDPVIVLQGAGLGNRVCGNAGDQLISRGRICRINDIEMLDPDAWRQAIGESPRRNPADDDG
ncbi:DUF6491 family protein [Arenimonas fontis]|uniref:Lipoprotein n=1 Tax=Arenimonas fontis TaxID=2608255 RepID=A0A5B2ZEI9_9GAMM|nr:DUF6491 family protein [Arenimonas fontis]KAA2285610.1 hypothetical protein F0415_02930 [Arenimonas fontis]